MLSPIERKPGILPPDCFENENVFVSDAWREAWWFQWGSEPGFHPLVQFKPEISSNFYIDRYRWKRILPIGCLQFVGTNYRRLSTPRSEYNSFSVNTDKTLTALENMLSADWTEAVFRDVIGGGRCHKAVANWAGQKGFPVRVLHSDEAYHITTDSDFQGYLGSLGKNTRLKLFNRRSLLKEQGAVAIESWPLDRLVEFFGVLNSFHSVRWGAHCFSSDSCNFHERFLHKLCEAGGRPELSVLTVDGKIESVLYNVHYRGVCYNLQAGFNEVFHKKIALGAIHLGYSIENAFNDPDIGVFDLLAGGGKRSNYKVHLATHSTSLISIMVVRNRFHRLLYWALDRVRAFNSGANERESAF
jgi:hypothetical protein